MPMQLTLVRPAKASVWATYRDWATALAGQIADDTEELRKKRLLQQQQQQLLGTVAVRPRRALFGSARGLGGFNGTGLLR